jgi:hypothetical protein
MSSRTNPVIATLVAALILPRLKEIGITLTTDDVIVLIGLVPAAWHGVLTFLEHYFPPKVPFTQPEDPAGATSK